MMIAIPRTKSSSMARPAIFGVLVAPAPPNNFMLFSPVTYRGRVALFAYSVAARLRARQLQGIDRQHAQVCARLAVTVQRPPLPRSPEPRQSATNAVTVTNSEKYSPHNDSLRDR